MFKGSGNFKGRTRSRRITSSRKKPSVALAGEENIQHSSEIKISDQKLIAIFSKVGLRYAVSFDDGTINKSGAISYIRPLMGLNYFDHFTHIGMSGVNGRGQFTIGDMTAIKQWYRQNNFGGRKSKKIYKMRRT